MSSQGTGRCEKQARWETAAPATQRGAATKLQHGVQVEQRSKDECWRKVVEDALAAKEKRRLYGAARFHLRTQ